MGVFIAGHKCNNNWWLVSMLQWVYINILRDIGMIITMVVGVLKMLKLNGNEMIENKEHFAMICLVYMIPMMSGLHLIWKHMVLRKQPYLFSITISLLVIFGILENPIKFIITTFTTFNNGIGINKNMYNVIISILLKLQKELDFHFIII